MQINHIATLYATLYSLQNLLILCASPIDCAYDKFHYLLMVGHSLLCSLVQVVALKVDGCPKVWVVTSDSVQQQAAHGAVSALIQSRLLKLLSIYLFIYFTLSKQSFLQFSIPCVQPHMQLPLLIR